MGTGACILDKESEMPCGLIIEKVNGYAVEKRLTKDESFADARYLLEMCRQVKSSLTSNALPRCHLKVNGDTLHMPREAVHLHQAQKTAMGEDGAFA